MGSLRSHVRAAAWAALAFGPSGALLLPAPAHAAWPDNGRAVCTMTGDQRTPVMIADGASGAILVWEDRRGTAADIYAQRVSSLGVIDPAWPADGRALCAAVQDQVEPKIAPDGAGGAFVVWEDYRAGNGESDIYAQRVSGSGAIAAGWPAAGVPVCTITGSQGRPTVVTDGAGGVIVAWEDRRGASFDIYAQRLNASGAPQWLANGVAVSPAAGVQRFPAAVPDASGGMIVAWQDTRSGDADIYAQRVSSSGTVQWPAAGVLLCGAVSDQVGLRIERDGSGGAIVAWEDLRDDNSDVYAQRVTAAGAPQWGSHGVAVCDDASEQYGVAITSDGAGGAFVSWTDLRIGEEDIYVQRVTGSASIASGWPNDGLAACPAPGSQYDAQVVADGAGGVLLSWVDYRPGAASSDVYAQRLTGTGAIAAGWQPEGLPFCNATGDQVVTAIVPDGTGGCILAWQDPRSGGLDIYATRVMGDGGNATLDVPMVSTPEFELYPAAPNPVGLSPTRLRFRLAGETRVAARIVDVSGRIVARLMDDTVLGAGEHLLTWDGRDQDGRPVPTGVYLYMLQAGREARSEKLAVLH
ncbi:MAG TPA: FlgD immunoglobulin-like domain containing protein [Candidatus Eisenbacteria bacterium]|nr:FlgD immunoglobulin-like domain containing protein [Candidatus Eisenbacteria bacterium]